MKKSARLAPLFVALSVVLSALPQAALAGSSMGSIESPAEISAASPAGAVAALAQSTALEPLNVVVAPADQGISDLDAALAPTPNVELAPADASIQAAAPAKTGAKSARTAVTSAVMNAGAALLGHLQNFVGEASGLKLFDNGAQAPAYARGFQGGLPPLKLPAGVKLDKKPIPPLGSEHEIAKHASPAAVLSNPAGAKGFSLVKLYASVNDPDSIEKALRRLIDDNRQEYKLDSMSLGKVHIEKVDVGGAADVTYHAVFRQHMSGADGDSFYKAAVAGAYISFVIKVVKGQAMLVPEATSYRLYPKIEVDTTPQYSDSALRRIAHKSLRPADAKGFVGFHVKKALRNAAALVGLATSADPVFITREIIYGSDKKWHAANLYVTPDQSALALAVDVATGKKFVWDGRVPLRNKTAAPANAQVAFGQVMGDANSDPQGIDNAPLASQPMPFMKIKDSKGNVLAITDANGLFSLNADGTAPIQVTVTLDNVRSHVEDQNAKNPPMKIQMTVVPGKTTQAIFPNPGDNPELVANVNGLLYASNHADWFQNVIGLNRLKGATMAVIKTNVPEDCNAAYQSSDNSLNLFHKSAKCENTAQPSVIEHETGHWVLQMHARFAEVTNAIFAGLKSAMYKVFQPTSDFVNATTNENFADYGAISHGGNPDLGIGFTLATPNVPLRSGRGMDQYDPTDEDPHQPAQMQFWYQSEVALVKAGLYAALDVQKLILSTIALNMPGDVASAVTQVVLSFMKDGQIPPQVLAILQDVAHQHALPWNGIPAPTPAPAPAPAVAAH